MSRDTQTIDRINPGVVDVLAAAASENDARISDALEELADMSPEALSAYMRHVANPRKAGTYFEKPLALLGLAFLHSIIIAERSCSAEVKRA